MKIKVVAFGVARDILGSKHMEMEIEDQISVAKFKAYLSKEYVAFDQLNSFAIAIDESYADDEQIIQAETEVVIIPPVSGG